MTPRRKFTAEFNAQVVLELRSGAKSRAPWCREHQIAASVLADWMTIFVAHAASIFECPAQRRGDDGTQIAELDRLVGRFSLETDIRKKATSLLHPRSKPRARSSECFANTILCARSVVS
jgi:transposase-like protein